MQSSPQRNGYPEAAEDRRWSEDFEETEAAPMVPLATRKVSFSQVGPGRDA